MKISFVHKNTVDPRTGVVPNDGNWYSGTPMQIVELEDMLRMQLEMNPTEPKHKDGCFFPIVKETLGNASAGNYSNLYQDGVAFIDLDHLSVEYADSIFNNFETIAGKFPALYSVCYSSSYYLKGYANNDVGLHIAVGISSGDGSVYYKLSRMAMAAIVSAVYKVLNINLVEWHKYILAKSIEAGKKPEKVLDAHNLIPGQRFYCHYSPYKINKHYTPKYALDNKFYSDNITKAETMLDGIIYFSKKENDAVSGEPTTFIKSSIVKHPFALDYTQAYHIANYLVYIGWKDADVVNLLLSIDTRDRDQFKKKHNKTLYSHYKQLTEAGHNRQLLEGQINYAIKLLNKAGIDICNKPVDGVIQLADNEWISDYKDIVLDHIQKNNVSYIIAPTGTGKTRFICDILAKELGAIVVVPFNAMHNLYNKDLLVIDSNTKTTPPQSGPLVINWDQYVKYYSILNNRPVIIDEAHCLYKDRSYRDKAIVLLNRLKLFNQKIVFVSATPEGELDLFNAEKLVFNRAKKIILTNVVTTKFALDVTYRTVLYAIKHQSYDRIVLFADRNSKRIYERLIGDGVLGPDEISYLKSDRVDTDAFKEVKKKEVLTRKLTIATCVAFNGFNFNNENEKVLIISGMYTGENTYSEIVQQFGRFRKCSVSATIIYSVSDINKTTVEEKTEVANKLDGIVNEKGIDSEFFRYDKSLTYNNIADARKEVEEYIVRTGQLDYILDKLKNEYNYIVVTKVEENYDDEIEYYVDKNGELKKKARSFGLAIKRRQSDIFVDELRAHCTEFSLDAGRYLKEFSEKYAELKKNKWVTDDLLLSLIVVNDKQKLVSTVMDELSDVIWLCNKPESAWQAYLAEDENVKQELEGCENSLKRYTKRRNKLIKLREEWKPFIDNYNASGNDESIINEMIARQTNKHSASTAKKKSGATKSKPAKQKALKDVETDEVFESCKAAAEHYNVSIRAISSWIKRKKLIVIK